MSGGSVSQEGNGGVKCPEACPCCEFSGPSAAFLARQLRYRLCRRCGSAWAMEVMVFEDYYRDYFPSGVREDNPLLARRYRAMLERMVDLAPGGSLLEVGCGNGQLLSVAKDMGWEVAGTEFSLDQVDHCVGRGLDVLYGDLTRDALFAGRRFEGAVLIEVFEHLPNPMGTLAELTARVQQGGILYLTTPNVSALSRRILGGRWSVFNEEHVVLASPKGLRIALEQSGWAPISVTTRNINLSEIRRQLRWSGAPVTSRERFEGAVAIQERVEGSRAFRAMKWAANRILGFTGTGDTLVAWARRQ